MVLGKLPVPGRPTIWITVGKGSAALAVGAGGGCLDIFTLIYPFFPLSPPLWETARYRLKYYLKGPLNPKPANNRLCSFYQVHCKCYIIKWHIKKIPFCEILDTEYSIINLLLGCKFSFNPTVLGLGT